MKVDVLGVKINTESKSEILEQIKSRLNGGQSTFVVTPYSESIVTAQQDEEFGKVINASDFALPDGAGVVWAAKFLRKSELQRIPGREFFWDLVELAKKNNFSIFLLGGYSDTPEIVARRLNQKFPNMRVAGTHAGHPGEQGIVEKINDARSDFLFVAFGPVTQEKWIYRNFPDLRVKLVMGVGGTFDYIAGKRPLPPQILSNMGLEWLWRLITQPWRIWRIMKGIFGLIWLVFRAKFSG